MRLKDSQNSDIEDNRYKCINAVYIGSNGQVLLMNVQTLMFRPS